jgi:hypothetical protein
MGKVFGYIAAGIGGTALVVGLIVLSLLLNGWVFSWLWLWFLVPLGLPAIGVVHAIGIAGAVGYITKDRKRSKESVNWGDVGFSVLAPFVALGFGYVITLFM